MSNAAITDGIGFAAASLVLATFCMRGMRTLRFVAIASNIAFIAYGYLGHLAPVLWLHALLLPINLCRLMQLRGEDVERPLGLRERATRRCNEEEWVRGTGRNSSPNRVR
jgi:hypothetical protein